MISNNVELTYEEDLFTFARMVPLVLVPLFGFTIILGMFTHKMTGPEEIHSSQMILFIYVFAKAKNVVMMPIEYLSLYILNVKYFEERTFNVPQTSRSRFKLMGLDASMWANTYVLFISLSCLLLRFLVKKGFIW